MSEHFIEEVSSGRWRYASHMSVALLSIALATTILPLLNSAPSYSANISSYLALWGGTATLLPFLFGQTMWLAPTLKFPATNPYHYLRSLVAVTGLVAFVWGVFSAATFRL
jgi:hypothetical protein